MMPMRSTQHVTAMPLQNRVTPTGEIVAVPARGTLMGNRGIIHDPDTKQLLTRRWQHQAWVCCELSFKNHRHPIMGRSAYTELFFLDEPTALAGGHRPCAYCRRNDFNAFKAAWLAGQHRDPVHFISARILDRKLHEERVTRTRAQVRFHAPWAGLPDGSLVMVDGHAHLINGSQLFPWHAEGYASPEPRPRSGDVCVLTPRSIVAALVEGFEPRCHPSIERWM